jgi:hypothetical protein
MSKPTSKTYIEDGYIYELLVSYIGRDGEPNNHLRDKLWNGFRRTHGNWDLGKMDDWYEVAVGELDDRIDMIISVIKSNLKEKL